MPKKNRKNNIKPIQGKKEVNIDKHKQNNNKKYDKKSVKKEEYKLHNIVINQIDNNQNIQTNIFKFARCKQKTSISIQCR